MPAWFYILRLQSQVPYCGYTKDRVRRYREHFAGLGGRTTKLDPPVAVVHEEEFNTYREALQREKQVKRWVRAKKEALIRGDLVELRRLSKRCKR